jgi:GTP cyclohydrolase I
MVKIKKVRGRGKPVTFQDFPGVASAASFDELARESNGEPLAGESGFPNIPPVAPRHPHLDMCEVINKMLGSTYESDAEIEKTAERFIRYLAEFNRPYMPSEVLGELFIGAKVQTVGGMIVENNIPFRMMCSHHLLPAIGQAWVGYIPRKHVVGLSKIPRLVQAVGTSRPGMQEVFAEEIADVLHDYVDANGTIVVVRSVHTCMACRGIYTPDVTTSTSCVRGLFRDVPQARSEFFSLADLKGK